MGSGGHAPEAGGTGYEKRDIDFPKVVIAGTLLLAGSAFSLVVMAWTFKYFAAREAREQPPPSTLTGLAGRGEPPAPRLQTTPFDDIRRLRAMEDAELTTYGWIDRKTGVVRIPIERAIDLVATRGLPAPPPGASGSVGGSGTVGTPGTVSDPGRAGSSGAAGVAGAARAAGEESAPPRPQTESAGPAKGSSRARPAPPRQRTAPRRRSAGSRRQGAMVEAVADEDRP